MQIPSPEMDFLVSKGYVSLIQKEDYDQEVTELSNLTQMNIDLSNALNTDRSAKDALEGEEKKTHSITFLFENKENKEAERNKVEDTKTLVSKMDADVSERQAKINELITKKSKIDRMVPYDGKYLSLTGIGIMMLNDLNVRNYRVSEEEFPDFIQEIQSTFGELKSIAERGNYHVANLKISFPEMDLSQLWSVSIGLAKIQGDPSQIGQRFLFAVDLLQTFRLHA